MNIAAWLERKLRVPRTKRGGPSLVNAALFALGGLVSSLALANDFQEYRRRGFILAGGATSCDDLAEDLATALHAQAGVDIYGSSCGPASFGYGFEVVVHYVAERPVPMTTTRHPRITAYRYGLGTTCLENLANEVAEFESSTGLTAFNAGCFVDPYSPGSHTFEAVIDAIGTSRVRVQIEQVEDHRPTDVANTLARLEARAQDLGIAGFHAWLEGDEIHSSIKMRYFKETEIDVAVSRFGVVDCPANLPRIHQALMDRARHPILAAYCTGYYGMAVFEIQGRGLGAESPPDVFVNMSDCESARPRIEAFYTTVLARDIVTSTCEKRDRDANAFRVSVISNLF